FRSCPSADGPCLLLFSAWLLESRQCLALSSAALSPTTGKSMPLPPVSFVLTTPRNLTWRWCFYVNLPIGGFTIVALLLFLHLESPPREQLSLLDQLKRLDPIGLFFFVPSMACLILALQWGGTAYPWSAPKIIGLLVTFAI